MHIEICKELGPGTARMRTGNEYIGHKWASVPSGVMTQAQMAKRNWPNNVRCERCGIKPLWSENR